MWPGILWFGLLTAAMLCYPRRPRLAGFLWIALGLFSLRLAFEAQRNVLTFLSSAFCIVLGIRYLVKYRTAAARAKHVEYWTAKA
jgi:hypothetical protein